jgi:hypothetical protein
VAAIARRRLGESTAAGRVEVTPADILTEPIPAGLDVQLVANVIHLFNETHARELLGRLRAAASGPTTLLLVDFWTDPTRTSPPVAALIAGEFLLVTGEGDVYSVEQIRAWLAEAGWTYVDHRPLAGPQTLIVATT